MPSPSHEFCLLLLLFWPCHAACGILVSQPGIEAEVPAVEAWSPDHRASREAPCPHF